MGTHLYDKDKNFLGVVKEVVDTGDGFYHVIEHDGSTRTIPKRDLPMIPKEIPVRDTREPKK